MLDAPAPPLDLASTPTPVQSLERIAPPDTLFVKRDDTTSGPAQGNKIRKLEYELGAALEANADAVVTGGGVQSNHCRATALLARRLGLEPHLVLLGEPDDVPDGNHLLSTLAAESITVIPETDFSGWDVHLETRAAAVTADGVDSHVIPIGASTPYGALGYVKAYQEIREWASSTDVTVDRIVVPTGSAGTQAGLLAASITDDGPAVTGIDVTPYGVSYQEQTVRALVEGIFELCDAAPRGVPDGAVDVRGGYLGPGYATPAPADLATITEVARTEGILLDPTYTGKAFRALLELREPDETCLFVHTGGSYGLFPQRQAIAAALER